MEKELCSFIILNHSQRQRAYDVFQLCSILLIPAMCTLKDKSISALVVVVKLTNV